MIFQTTPVSMNFFYMSEEAYEAFKALNVWKAVDPATPTDNDDPDEKGEPEAGNGVSLPEETGIGPEPDPDTVVDDEADGA